ncbi:MAG: efflux RND transporter periplasmic adaptor subunit [Litorimonas sp.]
MQNTVTPQTQASNKNTAFHKAAMISIPLLIIASFILVTFVIIKANQKPKERRNNVNTLSVMADYALQDTVQLYVNTQGEASPQTEIDFVPEVGGKVVYVSPNFIEGGAFKKGEILIRLEDADFRVAVARAKANVAQAQQTLVREIAEGEIARQDYAELGSGNASSLALREPQRKQAEAGLQAAMAELEGMNLQLTRTEIRAPFSGRVRTKNSDLGQFVAPGFGLGRIFSTDIVEVRLPLTDNDLSKIDLPIGYAAASRQSAPKVDLSAVIGGEKQLWEGRIMRTDPFYDTQTRTLFAVAEVYDPYGKGVSDGKIPLAPGLFVDAVLSGKKFENAIVLPRDALRPDDEVYVVDDAGKVDIRRAEVLDTNIDRAVLLSGVNAGELVVLSPLSANRINLALEVRDINDPDKVLVSPPKPEKPTDAEDKAKKKSRIFGKKSQKDGDNKSEKPLKKSDDREGQDDVQDERASKVNKPDADNASEGD